MPSHRSRAVPKPSGGQQLQGSAIPSWLHGLYLQQGRSSSSWGRRSKCQIRQRIPGQEARKQGLGTTGPVTDDKKTLPGTTTILPFACKKNNALVILLCTTPPRPVVGQQRNLPCSTFSKLMDVTMANDSCTLTHLFCTIHALQGKVEKTAVTTKRTCHHFLLPLYPTSQVHLLHFPNGNCETPAGTSLCCLCGLITSAAETNSYHPPPRLRARTNQPVFAVGDFEVQPTWTWEKRLRPSQTRRASAPGQKFSYRNEGFSLHKGAASRQCPGSSHGNSGEHRDHSPVLQAS